MTTKEERRKAALKRRDEKDNTIRGKLAQGGRVPVRRIANGSVRTTVWVSPDPATPMMIEFIRFYATSGFVGLTSLLEASDLVHALRGLSAAEDYVKSLKRPVGAVRPLDRETVLRAVSRGYNPPHKLFVRGNAAALLWTNDVNNGVDVVSKVELLTVREGEAECFFEAGQVADVRACLMDAAGRIEEISRSLNTAP